MKKKVLSVFLVLAMMLSLIPAMSFTASAAEPITYIERTWDEEEQKVVATKKVCTEYTLIDSRGMDVTILDGKWYVVKGTKSRGVITVNGTGHLILMDDCNFTVSVVSVNSGKNLHIYGQSEDSGALTIHASSGKPGIGGYDEWGIGYKAVTGNITIHGGNISATGGSSSAGIGGGASSNGGNVTILGGTVNATGGNYSAGIGGGNGGDGGTLSVYGGTVNATGYTKYPGFGAGYKGTTQGTLTVAPNAVIKAGDTAADTEMTAEEYEQNRNRYLSITAPQVEPTEIPVKYIDRTWNEQDQKVEETEKDCTDYIFINENTTELGYGKWYVAEGDLTNINRIEVTGTANLILVDGCTFNVNGISVEQGQDLHIYGQSQDSGKLYAASEYNSGIGKKYAGASINPSRAGNVTIHGGNVSTMGGQGSAGIGASERGYGGNVTILGGTVNAKGGMNAAGIGGGSGGDGGTVNIYGGNVTATGVTGIGAGNNGKDNGTLTVAPDAVIKAGDSEPGTEVTADEYIQNRSQYVNITFPDPSSMVEYIERTWDGENLTETEKKCANFTLIDESTTVLSGGKWYVADGEIDNDNRIFVNGMANLILKDGCTLTVGDGFNVFEGSTLNIYGQSENSGKLIAKASSGCAAIGGDPDENGGNVNIHGGTVTANGGADAAGIGGGEGGNGGTVTILSGNVTATGSVGIGAGDGGSEKGTLTLASGLATRAGASAPGTKMALDKYLQNGYKYINIAPGEPFVPVKYVERTWDGEKVVETEKECEEEYIVVDENTTTFEGGKWYVVKSDVTVADDIEVKGTANLILCDDCTLSLARDMYIELREGNTLNIYGQANDSGALVVSHPDDYCPAIGTVKERSTAGKVNIYGGNITADGGEFAAGIGGGGLSTANGGNVTVYGGTVTATGYDGASGIGGGIGADGGTVTVYGGTVDALAKGDGAGIGSGEAEFGKTTNGGTVYIYGGTVNAKGGYHSFGGDIYDAAGIGGGKGGHGANVYIYGGDVTAISGKYAAGIGGGNKGNGGNVAIYGGTVNATAGEHAVGIGGGEYGHAGNLYIYGGDVTATGGDGAGAIGSGYGYANDGTFEIGDTMVLKVGQETPDTVMTPEEYYPIGHRYAHIYDDVTVKGENWFITGSGTLFITGPVENTSTTTDYTPWKDYKSQITAVVAKDGAKVTNCDRLFSNCANLKSVDIAKLDVTGTTSMRYMFSGCPSLESLDLSTLDTSAVTSMMCMFYNASGLKSINVSGWNTSNVNDMQYMFNNCASLTELDLGSFDTSKVTTVYTMFYKCSNLEKLNIGNFSGDKLTSTDFVLSSCPALAEITVNGNALQKLAEPIISAGIVPVWYNNVTTEKYQTTDDLKAIEGKVTLVKSVPFLFDSVSLVLSGELGLNFYTVINDVEAVKDGYMLFEIGNKVETQAVYFTDAVLVDGRYVFTCNVNALQMADAITVSFHYGDVTVGPKTISVASYIDKLIEKHNNDDTDQTVKLAKSIVNYGHYAQLAQEETRHFTLGEDYAVTDNLSDVTIANASDLEAYKATKTGNIDGITKVSRSLSLDHGTDINLYFTTTGEYVPNIAVTDKNGDAVDFTLEKTKDGRYLLVIPQIAAHELGDMYTVSIDSGAMTVNVSALSYAYSVLSSDKSNAQKLCVSALYEYYTAAIAYRNAQ